MILSVSKPSNSPDLQQMKRKRLGSVDERWEAEEPCDADAKSHDASHSRHSAGSRSCEAVESQHVCCEFGVSLLADLKQMEACFTSNMAETQELHIVLLTSRLASISVLAVSLPLLF